MLLSLTTINSLPIYPGGCSRNFQFTSSVPNQSHAARFKDSKTYVATLIPVWQNWTQGEFDAIILASAGLIRLGFAARIASFLDVGTSLPANGQGAVGIECRTDDLVMQQLLAPLEHQETRICVLAERAMNRKLQGGCQVPIGAFAVLNHNELWLRGLVGQLDGSEILRAEIKGQASQAELLGTQLAEQLLALGADRILDAVYRQA